MIVEFDTIISVMEGNLQDLKCKLLWRCKGPVASRPRKIRDVDTDQNSFHLNFYGDGALSRIELSNCTTTRTHVQSFMDRTKLVMHLGPSVPST